MNDVAKKKFGGYHPPKRMTKEEFSHLVKANHNVIRNAATALMQLSEKLGPASASDFNFTTLDAVKNAKEGLIAVGVALEDLQNNCKIRAKTRLVEEC